MVKRKLVAGLGDNGFGGDGDLTLNLTLILTWLDEVKKLEKV